MKTDADPKNTLVSLGGLHNTSRDHLQTGEKLKRTTKVTPSQNMFSNLHQIEKLEKEKKE